MLLHAAWALCMGSVMALHVARIVSFCFPHAVDASILIICIVPRAFVVVISMCLLHVSLGSRVSPSIFGLRSWGLWCCPSAVQVVCCIPPGLA